VEGEPGGDAVANLPQAKLTDKTADFHECRCQECGLTWRAVQPPRNQEDGTSIDSAQGGPSSLSG
jgi:hypothetical protein